MATTELPFYDETPEDKDPAYYTPFGKLPNNNPDDQPDGVGVSFSETIFSQEARDEIAIALMADSLIHSQEKALRLPLHLHKKFVKEAKASARLARTQDKDNKHSEKNIAFYTELRKFYSHAANNLTLDLSVAMNAILENMAQYVESNHPTIAAKVVGELRGWRIGTVDADDSDDD